MSSPPSSPRGSRIPAVQRPSSPRAPKATPVSPRAASPRGSQPRKPVILSSALAGARPRPAGGRPPLPPGVKPLLEYGNASESTNRDDDALAEMRPSQHNSEAGSGASTPVKGDLTSSGAPTFKKKAKSETTRVRVFVRVRPSVRKNELETAESDKGGTSTIHCQGPKLWLMEDGTGGEKGGKGGQDAKTRQYIFDGSLSTDSTQEDVYRIAVAETGVVSSVMEGINGCVMCYGQTGAGKTHTLGNVSHGTEGVVWRALDQILGPQSVAAEEREVKLSYVQIYMEQIYDLIDPSSQVDLREDPREGTVLTGAKTATVNTVEEAVQTIANANTNRVTSATAMNDASSRSHSVLLVDVMTKSGSRILRGKLHLVDLAGSERVKKSEVQGQAFDEAIAINNSLTTLGRCVQALAAGPKGGKPPFRDTKLTRLLSSAFGGRANTVLLVCVAPTASDSFETVNSLNFGQQAMSVKVQARVNASIDFSALEEELWWKLYESQQPNVKAEVAAWLAVRPEYASQQAVRVALRRERDKMEGIKLELQILQQELAEAQQASSGKLARKRHEHERKIKAMRKQQAASAAELEKLRSLASSAGIALPEPSLTHWTAREGGIVVSIRELGEAIDGSIADNTVNGHSNPSGAEHDATRFDVRTNLHGLKTLDGMGADDEAALEKAARAAMVQWQSRGRDDGCATSVAGYETPRGGTGAADDPRSAAELAATVGAYQGAVERAWADVQRLEDERHQVGILEKASEQEAQRLEREREDMEATLHDVASDLGRLALLYRTQGKAPHAVPLYMTALAIYEKTLGPDHPEVAKDLVNLGNAFCDQNQHTEAVPLYLRALAIDQAALGDDHPEVAMDLSNLGIVYRVQGRRDEAIALFQRAHTIMCDALGPDDPKTLTVSRNLSATQVIEVTVNDGAAKKSMPKALEQRLLTPRGTKKTVEEKLQAASEKRDAGLSARIERAAELRMPRGGQSSKTCCVHADVNDSTTEPPVPKQQPVPAPAPLVVTPDPNHGQPDDESHHVSSDVPTMQKLKLFTTPSTSSDMPVATPRSTYSKATREASAAASAAARGGKGSGRSMLRQHVATFDFSSNDPATA